MENCVFCFKEYDDEIAQGVCPYCGYYEGRKQKDPRYLPIGTLLHERYIIGGVIGDGGFGITYYAYDKTLQTVVALKEYYQSGVVNRIPGTEDVFISAPNRREEFEYGKNRLLREAQIVSQFQSSSIVRVNDYFEANGTSYMVMEFLDALTLTDYLLDRNETMTPDQVVDIGGQICDALTEIHSVGMLHRDIAPDNIFISSEGKVKIIDFGSASLSEDDTVERLILVKEGFSPIEQYEVIDIKQKLQQPWTDIYALGATLYYCLTGVMPIESRVRKKDIDENRGDIKQPSELNYNVSENLNNTIMKAMAINSHERFATAAEMKAALVGEVKVPTLENMRKRKRRIRALSIAGGFCAALLIAWIAIFNGNKKYDEIVLDPAAISIWYSADADKGIEASFDKGAGTWLIKGEEGDLDQRASSLMHIVEAKAASGQFEQVDVELKAIPADQYKDEIMKAYKAGVMPNIFEVGDADAEYMEDVYDVSEIASNLNSDARDCYFMNDNKKAFEELKAIPTGIHVPVIYINTSIVKDFSAGTEISSMEDLLQLAHGELKYKPIAIDPAAEGLFRKTFSDYEDMAAKLNVVEKDAFLQERAALLLSTASDYDEVQDSLIGIYKIAYPKNEKVAASFVDYWSIKNGTAEENEASEVLLSYFYTNNAQDQLYLSEKAQALPLNKGALDKYVDVYSELQFVTEQTGNYQFERGKE